jgi:Uncharacterised nucleotidyltransferase
MRTVRAGTQDRVTEPSREPSVESSPEHSGESSPEHSGETDREPSPEALRESLKRVAVSLKEIGRPYALTGGYAAWALGAPESAHDVDFLVHPDDIGAIVERLREDGLEVEHPPEDWLVKVRTDGVVVDLLHRANGFDIADGLARAELLHVLSVEMAVLSATDLVTEKLLALDEHYCDLSMVLPTLRALREKVDWAVLADRCNGAPFAEATLFLLERLGVV